MEGEDGCGCRSQPPASAALWLLALLGVRRRRSNTTALRA
jgi:MYXO-CTERM domain-containing protein